MRDQRSTVEDMHDNRVRKLLAAVLLVLAAPVLTGCVFDMQQAARLDRIIDSVDPAVIEVDEDRSQGGFTQGVVVRGAIQAGASSDDVAQTVIDGGVTFELTLPNNASLRIAGSNSDPDRIRSGVALAMTPGVITAANEKANISDTFIDIDVSVTWATELMPRFREIADLAQGQSVDEVNVHVVTDGDVGVDLHYRLQVECYVEDRDVLEEAFAAAAPELGLNEQLGSPDRVHLKIWKGGDYATLDLRLPELTDRDESDMRELHDLLITVVPVRLTVDIEGERNALILE